jgi:hypothetical protein
MPNRDIPFSSGYGPKEPPPDTYNSSGADQHFLPPITTNDASQTHDDPERRYEAHVERLIDRLPDRVKTMTRWLRHPSSRWARLPAGILLIGGGLLSFLPILGIWMLPLGLILLAEDIRPFRRLRNRIIDWIGRRRPHWFAENGKS